MSNETRLQEMKRSDEYSRIQTETNTNQNIYNNAQSLLVTKNEAEVYA